MSLSLSQIFTQKMKRRTSKPSIESAKKSKVGTMKNAPTWFDEDDFNVSLNLVKVLSAPPAGDLTSELKKTRFIKACDNLASFCWVDTVLEKVFHVLGDKPDHWAIFADLALVNTIDFNDPDATKFIVQHGANVNIQLISNSTPLLHAIKNGYTELTDLLLDKGANVNASDEWGWNSVYYAVGSAELAPAYEHRPPKDYIYVLKRVISMNADVNAISDHKQTPLHHAAQNGNVKAVQILLDSGANAAAKDCDGKTPSDLCERCYNPDEQSEMDECKRLLQEAMENQQKL